MLGPVQLLLADESRKEAIADEIERTEKASDLEYKECTIAGHEHPPLPMLKGSYGKSVV